MKRFIMRITKSRNGHSLLILNLCLVAYVHTQFPLFQIEHKHENCMTVYEASKDENAFEIQIPESALLATTINAPAIILSILLSIPFAKAFSSVCSVTFQNIQLLSLLALCCIQWMCVGAIFDFVYEGIEKQPKLSA